MISNRLLFILLGVLAPVSLGWAVAMLLLNQAQFTRPSR
jgi:hypothetical protein